MRRARLAWATFVATALLALLALLALAGVLWHELSGGADTLAPPAPASADQIAHGAYLARIGNCHGCHTAPGGAPYAGGLAIPTPFGKVIASNLTPDLAAGVGQWSTQAFWRALHEGRSRDGRLLYPAFPYAHTTHVSRADSDALLAYLRSLSPVAQPTRPHELRFPYSTQAALAVWRVLYFRPADPALPLPLPVAGPTTPAGATAAELARGAYLVHGLGHCGACHARRNAWGATTEPLSLDGGQIAGQPWAAPSLRSAQAAGLAGWPLAQAMALLTTGRSDRARARRRGARRLPGPGGQPRDAAGPPGQPGAGDRARRLCARHRRQPPALRHAPLRSGPEQPGDRRLLSHLRHA